MLTNSISKFQWIFITIAILSASMSAQVEGNDRSLAQGMLNNVKNEIKSNYYDTSFRSVDIEYVWELANQKIKTDLTRDAMMMTIASAVLTLDDSHTTFFPPSRAADIEYGWVISMIGDGCYVIAIKPQSDAEAKGLKIGDRVLQIDGVKPTRDNRWKTLYRLYAVMPATKVTMTVIRPGEEQPRSFEIHTKISKTATALNYETLWVKILRNGWDKSRSDKYVEFGDDLLIWRMRSFQMSESALDSMMSKARQHKSLILDLRNNGGGHVDILKRLVGNLFEKDIKIADEKTRKTTKPIIAKTRGKDLFKGNLIVLVNNSSASASEVLARIVQLENRGKVIGDRSMGAVMESKFFDMNLGVGSTLYYGMSITIADLIMPDGKSLEKTGVIPDEMIVPTGQDVAQNKDPVLAHAAKLLGVDLSPEKAGTFFPFDWND
jgi:C-terminal processing protease CtpA/Prc